MQTLFLFWKELFNGFASADRNFEGFVGEKILPKLSQLATEIKNYLLSFDSEYLPVFEIENN